mmetsp:Transcript_55592/g.67047  ORF Transcript_55592/g.67047 Transcript_55592/m.67047 type:complete len:82 (-) Transcript_55592:33-278(-)
MKKKVVISAKMMTVTMQFFKKQIDDLGKQFAHLLLDIGFLPANYRHNVITNNRFFVCSSNKKGDRSTCIINRSICSITVLW